MPARTPTSTRERPPHSLRQAQTWTWFRANFGLPVVPPVPVTPVVVSGSSIDRAALATAFWQWVGSLDAEARFEKIDLSDFTHYAAGQLLRCLLIHRPMRLPNAQRSAEVRAMTQAVLATLCEWKRAMGEPLTPEPTLPAEGDALWAGFLEDTAQDPVAAVAYLDRFSGVEPDWQSPQLVISRPAMRAAMEALRASGTRAPDSADTRDPH